MFNKAAIIGVGLIGGSLGYEIKRKRLARIVIGCGRTQKNLTVALKKRLIDRSTRDLSEAVKDADLILLCAPVNTIEKQISVIAKRVKKGALIMDVGSTKALLVRKAEKILPKSVDFVGAHPIAGTERSGAGAALPELFKKKKCLLTPGKKTSRRALLKAKSFWKKMGSEVYVYSPDRHDEILAATSHLPHMAAFGLVEVLDRLLPFSEIRKMAGGGLLDTTRIAASSAEMWADICLSNSKSLSKALQRYLKEIQKLSIWVRRKDKRKLFNYFKRASSLRSKLS